MSKHARHKSAAIQGNGLMLDQNICPCWKAMPTYTQSESVFNLKSGADPEISKGGIHPYFGKGSGATVPRPNQRFLYSFHGNFRPKGWGGRGRRPGPPGRPPPCICARKPSSKWPRRFWASSRRCAVYHGLKPTISRLFSEALRKLGFPRIFVVTTTKFACHPVNCPMGNFDTKIINLGLLITTQQRKIAFPIGRFKLGIEWHPT